MKMKRIFIKLPNAAVATKFVSSALDVDGDVNVRKGIYCIDGKSIMGMFSLDFYSGLTVEYPETAEEFEKFICEYRAV